MNPAPLLAFAAHPDDLEFAIGAIIAKETQSGRPAHFVICSHGESASNGTPDQRTAEAAAAAKLLGATLEFLDLDGDAHLTLNPAHAIALARIIRQQKPAILLAPTPMENQHPDHHRLALLSRDAARLARFGGLAELRDLSPHAINALLFYAITPDAEPRDIPPILVDISDPALLDTWTRSMQAHASQMKTKNYVEIHLTRARLLGLRAGTGHALPLFPNDPLVFASLAPIIQSARAF
jgi:LmbE family N-acetylglucosaminyl deacetylase